MARRQGFHLGSYGRRTKSGLRPRARRLAIEPLEDRRLLSVSSLYSQVRSLEFDGVLERPDEFALTFSDDGGHAYVTGRADDALIVYRRDPESGVFRFAQGFEEGFEKLVQGPLLRAEVTPLADGSIVYDIYFDVNSDRHSAVAIDLKFSGNIVQLPSPVTGAAVADRATAFLTAYLDPDYDLLGDSWFHFGTGTSWVADLPTTHEDHPEGFAGIGLAEVDGAMFIAAGSGAGSSVEAAAVAHIVVAPTAENPSAALTISGIVAWEGQVYNVSGSFDSISRPDDLIVSYLEVGSFGGNTNGIDGLDGASSVALSPDGSYVYVSAEEDNTLVVFSRDQASGELVLDQLFRDGDDLPDASAISGLAGASGVYVSDDGAEIHVTGSAEGTAVLFRRDLQGGSHEFVDVVEWQPPEPPPAEEPVADSPAESSPPLESEPTGVVDEPPPPDEAEPTDIIDPPPAEPLSPDESEPTGIVDEPPNEGGDDDVFAIQPLPINPRIITEPWLPVFIMDPIETGVISDLESSGDEAILVFKVNSIDNFLLHHITISPTVEFDSISVTTVDANGTVSGAAQVAPVNSVGDSSLAFATLAIGELSDSSTVISSRATDRIAAASPIVVEPPPLRPVFVSRRAARASGAASELSELRAVGGRTDSEGAESFWDRALEELLSDEEPDGGWFTF